VSSCTAKQEHRGIGYEVNRSEKQTNSLGNFTEIPEPIVAQRYTVAYPVYRLPALPLKSESGQTLESKEKLLSQTLGVSANE